MQEKGQPRWTQSIPFEPLDFPCRTARVQQEVVVSFRLGRRDFMATGLVAAPFVVASAQASLRIGWLSVSPHPFVADFRDRLKQLGYVEGENLVIEYRYADGDAALLPALVEELVKARVSILVTSGSAATDAAVAAGGGVPIVFVTSDPTILGQIGSLSRPGGMATGISTMSEEIAPKKIDLMRNTVPALTRLAILKDDSSGGARQAQSMAASARASGSRAASSRSPSRTCSRAPSPPSRRRVVRRPSPSRRRCSRHTPARWRAWPRPIGCRPCSIRRHSCARVR